MRGSGPGTFELPLGRPATTRVSHFAGLAAAALVVCAVAVAILPWPDWQRALAAGALVVLAALVSRAGGRRQVPPRGWVRLDDAGLHRMDHGSMTTLVGWAEPFGLTVLGSVDRATLLLAVTSPRAMRYLPVRVFDADDAARAPHLLAQAATASDSDLRADDEASLCAADAERLLSAVGERAATALDCMYLSDASGQAVVLEPGLLRVGARRIDLSAPLEWRASLYQERGAQAASVCQATWVRQGDVEVVFVAPLPADSVWTGDVDVAVKAAGVGLAAKRAIARDLRLVQAAAGDAPPRDARCAIDRVFMLPLRRALNLAPHVPLAAASPSRTMPEGRA